MSQPNSGRARPGAHCPSAWALGLVAAFLLALPTPAPAQPTGSIRGVVRDADGPVFAAAIVLSRGGQVVAGVESDAEGRFGFEDVLPGVHTLKVVRIGYADVTRLVSVAVGVEREVVIELQLAAVVVEGVRVRAERSRERERFDETAGATVREISAEQLKLVPGVAEADPIRAVEALPGVVSTSDFSAAFHVRGGSADQNLILLDGAPIFSPFHLGGLFSVFNADMVERAELSSGGFPAAHGGRVSSVLAIVSDPGLGESRVDAGISLLAARVALAGGASPGVRDALGVESLRWRVSARRSYFDQVLRPFFQFPYHLDDLQGVAEAQVSHRDRVRVTAYRGRDVLDLTALDDEDFPLRVDWDWGNDVLGATWDRELARGGRLSVSTSFSRFATGLRFPDFDDTEFRSRIDLGRLAGAAGLQVRPALRVEAGALVERYAYDNLARSGGTEFGRGLGTGLLLGSFVQANWGRPGRWLAETGLRLDHWAPSRGESVAELSPRVSAKWFFDGSRWALKASAGRYTQFLHSLRDEELPIGLDVWVLASERAPHVVSDQAQIGVEAFPDDVWNLSLEAYYRSFDGVVTFNPADDPNTDLDDLLSGRGRSWGVDALVRRSRGTVNGWLALSFLKAQRTFPDPLAPDLVAPEVTYPPIFDRRLDLDLVLRFPGPRGWDGGLRLNVGTGLPYTRPRGSYAYYHPRFLLEGGRYTWEEVGGGDGSYAVLLGDRNVERYPVYHRLDLSFRKTLTRSWGTLTPHVDLLNVYNRRNVLFYFFELEKTPPVRTGISMFPFLPTVGLEVRFR